MHLNLGPLYGSLKLYQWDTDNALRSCYDDLYLPLNIGTKPPDRIWTNVGNCAIFGAIAQLEVHAIAGHARDL